MLYLFEYGYLSFSKHKLREFHRLSGIYELYLKMSLQTILPNQLPPARALNPKIRRYTFQKKLGEGAFGRVFLGETIIGGRQLHAAIKCIRRADEYNLPYVYNEQSFNKLLTTYDKFGYFPQLVESFSDAHNFYLCSELIPGGSLRDEIRRSGGRLKPERAQFVMAQCVRIPLLSMNGMVY